MFDKAKRSQIMASNRSRNTLPERIVFEYLHSKNIYFQRHYDRAPGRPDVAIPSKKKVVFIDGDFWHGRLLDRVRKSRGSQDEWTTKIERTIQRDSESRALLVTSGWKILAVWETDITSKRTQPRALEKINRFLTS
jgi:DNA mismatch endonuclease (patch repair protein)